MNLLRFWARLPGHVLTWLFIKGKLVEVVSGKHVLKKSAERVGFEPTIGTRPITVFETAPFNRSGISPNRKAIIPEE